MAKDEFDPQQLPKMLPLPAAESPGPQASTPPVAGAPGVQVRAVQGLGDAGLSIEQQLSLLLQMVQDLTERVDDLTRLG